VSDEEISVYDEVGGMPFFQGIAARFYEGIRTDAVLLPLYPDGEDLVGATHRLALFLAQYWGGPHTYNEERGQPMLRARHMPYRIAELERDHWLLHMLTAVSEADISDETRGKFVDYFVKAAEHLRNDQPLRLVNP
jgi:hemoglobin